MKKYLIFTLLLLLSVAMQAQQKTPNKGDSYTLTVSYFYVGTQTSAAPDSVLYLEENAVYSIVSPTIPGYTPDRPVVEGKMPGYDHYETVLYSISQYHAIVDPNITHGTVTVSPNGNVNVGTTVTITVHPEAFYELESLRVINMNNASQTVAINNNTFVMPSFDVMVTATFALQPPTITGSIVAPQAICSGNALTLTAPSVANADQQGWQMAPDATFGNVVAYTGQVLDGSYNGWKLRYMASNATGTVYSNVVNITVNVLEPTLTGDLSICTMQTGTYTAGSVGNATLTWTVSDAAATVTESGKTLKVQWFTAGQQTITLNAYNEETGCSATVIITVNVLSFVNSNDVNKIVAKKHDGRDYILIYPNPKESYKYQWYKDGAAIKDATGQYLYQSGGLDAGAYKVYLSLNADANGNLIGGAFTNEYTVTGAAKLNLCPNPAQENEGVIIMNESGEETLVSIFTLDGRMVHQQTVSGTQATLDVKLSQGMYIVKFIDAQYNETNEKLIIK
jgi:hypothetical protein